MYKNIKFIHHACNQTNALQPLKTDVVVLYVQTLVWRHESTIN